MIKREVKRIRPNISSIKNDKRGAKVRKKAEDSNSITQPENESIQEKDISSSINPTLNYDKKQEQGNSLTKKLLLIIAILAAFIALISLNNYSGDVTVSTEKFLFTKTGTINIPYTVLDIKKGVNSALSVDYTSDIISNVFIETTDCEAWKNGKDNNRYVLYAISNVKNAGFKIGDMQQKSKQQIELYKIDNLCMVLINKEQQKQGQYTITAKETDRNIYNIIE
ncbi:hypothetical protein J4214_00455 [Candidatus Woesearchaeota archaeon]|nr:hypothetical protein [Candidatus Woesearchaeota archaeon]